MLVSPSHNCLHFLQRNPKFVAVFFFFFSFKKTTTKLNGGLGPTELQIDFIVVVSPSDSDLMELVNPVVITCGNYRDNLSKKKKKKKKKKIKKNKRDLVDLKLFDLDC